MERYEPEQIERKWQEVWEREQTFEREPPLMTPTLTVVPAL